MVKGAPCLSHGQLNIKKQGIFNAKSYTFSISDNDILKASPIIFKNGSFKIEAKDIKQSFSPSDDTMEEDMKHSTDWQSAGSVTSPGLLFDRTIARDKTRDTKLAMVYNNTSRTGDLMNLKVMIPKIQKVSEKALAQNISSCTILPIDCSQIVAQYTQCYLTSKLSKKISSSNCHKLLRPASSDSNDRNCDKYKEQRDSVMIMRNKLPTWNAQINAYTLEFGGRALVPSVHNFQLIDSEKRVVLQLGKVSESSFNVDFSFPLSPYQAFGICLSVIDRTFVWD